MFKARTLSRIAEMICGNFPADESFFEYRTSKYLTEFFRDCETDYEHDGSTRAVWVTATLEKILAEPQLAPNVPPEAFARVVARLMDPGDATNEGPTRGGALSLLNVELAREGYEAFYAPDKICYLRHFGTGVLAAPAPNPYRPFSAAEIEKRDRLALYLEAASEDDLIERVLLPLFRLLGFHRITAAGHKDKALEYGKDVWMKYTLPTQHVLYFGLQAKKGKLDAKGMSTAGNANVAEIHNQALMMLGHEIFDPETSRRALVDHAFIVAGGEITKQAKNWLGDKLDASRRSQIMFMDRDDILNLHAVTNLPVPSDGEPPEDDDLPL